MTIGTTCQTSVDPSLLSRHNFPVRSFLQSNIGLPKVTFAEDFHRSVMILKVEVDHDGKHYEAIEEHFFVNSVRDQVYYARVIRRLADRLLLQIVTDETDLWIDLTP